MFRKSGHTQAKLSGNTRGSEFPWECRAPSWWIYTPGLLIPSHLHLRVSAGKVTRGAVSWTAGSPPPILIPLPPPTTPRAKMPARCHDTSLIAMENHSKEKKWPFYSGFPLHKAGAILELVNTNGQLLREGVWFAKVPSLMVVSPASECPGSWSVVPIQFLQHEDCACLLLWAQDKGHGCLPHVQ